MVNMPGLLSQLDGDDMKARTKAAKREAKKRGRPVMDAMAREPNGRISRSGIDHGPADIVALNARARHTGLCAEKAKDQKAGSFIGYLNLLGPQDGMATAQYDAAVNFLAMRTAYLRAIKAPGVVVDGDMGQPSEEISEAYEDWARGTKEAYHDCRKAIQDAQNENRHANLWAALDICLIQDQWMHHMVGDVRILCNALAKFFRT